MTSESDILNQVGGPVKSAILELFKGNRKDAEHWLTTPCKALGNISPIDCMNQSQSDTEVLNLISQLEHGVFQ